MAYTSRTLALSVAAGLVALASVAAAQSTRPTPEGTAPQPGQHHGMKMDHQMMPGMDAAQMRKMMESCMRMMSDTSPKTPEVPGQPPESKPKG